MALTSSTLHGTGRLKRLVAAGMAAFAAAVLAVGVCAGTAQAANDPDVISVTEDAAQPVTETRSGYFDIIDGAGSMPYRSQEMELKNNSNHYLRVTIEAKSNKKASWHLYWGASNSNILTNEPNGWVVMCTNAYVAPGASMKLAGWGSGHGQTFKATFEYYTDFKKPVNTTIQTKKPTVKATKLSASKASIKLTVPEAADVTGLTQIDVYAGSKKIKSFVSRKESSDVILNGDVYSFTYSAKGAGTAKYYVKLTTVGNKNDNIKSATVKPGANVLKVKPKAVSGIGVQVTKLSYSGSKLVIQGKLVNKMGAAIPYMVNIVVYSRANGGMVASVMKQVTFPKGTKSFKYVVKAKRIIDLTNPDDLSLTY